MLTSSNIQSLIRAGLATWGGALITDGTISNDQIDQVAGGVAVLVAVIWSLIKNYFTSKKVKEATSIQPMDVSTRQGGYASLVMIAAVVAIGLLVATGTGYPAAALQVVAILAVLAALTIFRNMLWPSFKSLFKDSSPQVTGNSQAGSAGIIMIIAVLLSGLSLNAAVAEKEGKPVSQWRDVKHSAEVSFETRKPLDYSKMNQ